MIELLPLRVDPFLSLEGRSLTKILDYDSNR